MDPKKLANDSIERLIAEQEGVASDIEWQAANFARKSSRALEESRELRASIAGLRALVAS